MLRMVNEVVWPETTQLDELRARLVRALATASEARLRACAEALGLDDEPGGEGQTEVAPVV